MKKILTVLSIACALALTANADDKDHKKDHKSHAGQKELKKAMREKYDTNKNGKLDKEERAKISTEDKEKMKKAGLGRHKKDQN